MNGQALEAGQPQNADRLRRLIAVQAELSDPDLGAEAVIDRAVSRAVELTAAHGAEVQVIDGDEIVIAASVGFGAERRGHRFPVRGNPINGCLAEGRAEMTDDASIDPRCEQSIARVSGIRSLVTAPMTDEGRIIGGLQIHSAEPDAFTAADEGTVELLAGFAAASISRAKAAAASREAEKNRLGEIVDAQLEIASCEHDVDRLLAVLADRTVRLTGAGAAAVMLPDGDKLVVRASAGEPPIELGYALPVGESLAGIAFRTGQVQRCADAASDPRVHSATAKGSGLRAMISTPLMHGSQVIGVLQLMSEQPGALDEVDVRTLEMVAAFAASAFDRASTSSRLQASDRRTRAVIESAPYPIVIFDTDTGRIVEFNPAAEAGFGWARADAVGKPATMLLPNRHVEAFNRWLRDGRDAGTQIYAGSSFETTGRKADGAEFPIEVAVADLPEETHLAGAFIRDVSLRYRLRESRERLASVVAGTPVILLACDVDGTITLSEGKGLTAFGLTPADTAGRNLRELLADEPDALEHLDRALRGESFSGLIHLVGPDVFLEASYSPIRNIDGAMTGVSAMLTDVSDRIHAEAAKRESDAKSRLMAMMNHEVRTPLNSILGFATLLAESRAGALNDQQRHYLANIEAAGRQLLELVNESLDLAKLKAGHMDVELRSLSADPLMESTAAQMRPMADAGRVALLSERAPQAVVRADQGRLVQVLLNLLSNAIRHTPPGGKVTLSSSVEGERVIIRVADNGQGIAREDLVHIFEEFYQARNHAPGGTGLGLTISRRLVEEMGGTIEVASELGVGSTFTVKLGRGEVQRAQS